jgi:energy-coupling factor transport system ATP-binding protein
MPIIETHELTHVYLPGTPYEKKALQEVSLVVEAGELVAVIGANGSGKSTLMQHFNGLLLPTGGRVWVDGKDTAVKNHRLNLWKEVGLVFQFPEQQIFAGTVLDEMAFGLKNLGLKHAVLEQRIDEALVRVGLNPGVVLRQSPMQLSGGQRRLLALASIMAMQPRILVLDEPTAGLDSAASRHVLTALQDMRRCYQTTIIMVSHQADDLIDLADKMAFLDRGRLLFFGSTRQVLRQIADYNRDDLFLPDHLKLMYCLQAAGYQVDTDIFSLDEAAREVGRLLKESGR